MKVLLLSIIFPAITTLIAPQLGINDSPINIEIAQTNIQRQRGLSFRESLPQDTGMLFIFDNPSKPNFWMKDMNFSIDIIWINENGYVTGVEENISPDTYPNKFSPQEPALYVLETNADWVSRHQINIGDKVEGLITLKLLGLFVLSYLF